MPDRHWNQRKSCQQSMVAFTKHKLKVLRKVAFKDFPSPQTVALTVGFHNRSARSHDMIALMKTAVGRFLGLQATAGRSIFDPRNDWVEDPQLMGWNSASLEVLLGLEYPISFLVTQTSTSV